MTQVLEGGCRCDAVRYSLALDRFPRSYACHCHQCQRWSGSAFSLNVLIPEASLKVDGPIAFYELATEDRVSSQRMCSTCHSRIFNTNSRRPGIAVLRAGTLDRSEELTCGGHIFIAYKQAWIALLDGVPSWPAAPTPQEFLALAMGK